MPPFSIMPSAVSEKASDSTPKVSPVLIFEISAWLAGDKVLVEVVFGKNWLRAYPEATPARMTRTTISGPFCLIEVGSEGVTGDVGEVVGEVGFVEFDWVRLSFLSSAIASL